MIKYEMSRKVYSNKGNHLSVCINADITNK